MHMVENDSNEELIIDENLIMIDLEAENSNEAIKILASVLVQNNFVKKSYIKAVQEREKNFPTGLPIQNMGVAIPHTDVEHVNVPAVAIGILRNPVTFQVMGAPEEKVDVEIMFMLAIKEPHAQLEILQKLMGIFQREEALAQIKKCAMPSEVTEIFTRLIK